MAGYIHDPLQIINLIADNLRDRYKSGFPVLKEIIQNADDAGSADESIQLEFGLSPGIFNAEHPLLKGPALYFLNNGAFADTDYKAIRSFGLNRKAIEQSSIGKFGLGMKSVFHFCEAFFFLAQNTDREYAEILNPWSGDDDFSSFHDDWNNFSPSDVGLIREQVQPVLERMDLQGSFFLLWLPLRQKKHLLVNGKEVGSIISEFPGDNKQLLSFLFQQELAQKIASLLPLLRRINSIRFWHTNGSGSIASSRFQVSMKGTSRIGLADGQHQSKDLEGSVHYHYNGKEDAAYALIYSGREKLLEIPELLLLRKSPLWPKSYVRDDLGKSQEAPDKARGHGAVVFSRSNEKETGSLKIRWAVFLPVNETEKPILIGGDSCFRLILHGYFFVDAGRMDIEGLQEGVEQFDTATVPQNEVELRRLWNIRLARQGTLPLVLPALEAFIAKARLSADDIWNLSEGIRESRLFRRHRESICMQSSWACCLTRKGREWHVLASDYEILPLPGPPLSAPERPWKTLPRLEAFQNRSVAFLLKDAPHLLLDKTPPHWNEQNLLEVLHLKEKEVFANQGCLDYLLQFMENSVKPFHKTGTLQEKLREIANQAFIALGTDLRQHRKKVQEFVAFILPERRYSLKPDAPQVIRELQQCKTGVLILANEFDPPESSCTARLTLDDALVLLKKLHDMITGYEERDEQEMIKHCRAIAREILQGQDEEQRRSLLIQAEGLKILEGYDCLLEKLVALSPADLKDCHGSRLVYLYSQGLKLNQWVGLALKLQKAIQETVVLVKSGTAELVFGRNNDLVSCHADSVLDSLGSECLPLQTIDNRRQLLPDVAGADLDSQRRVRGLRYLLHGLDKYFDAGDTLWVSGYDQSPVWGKLWQQLESHHEDGWNLLDRKLVEEIPPNKWPRLSIREIKPDGILDELRDMGTEEITGEQFIQEERNAVLKELVSDDELWSRLPFHETVKGELVSITTGKSYLETGISLPDELNKSADIIKISTDPVVKRQQREWVTPLDSRHVAELALLADKPERFWRLILEAIGDSDEEKQGAEETILETEWLPTKWDTVVNPANVIFLPEVEDEISRLTAKNKAIYTTPSQLHVEVRNHDGFPSLLSLFSVKDQGLEKLALLLADNQEYHLGEFPTDGSEELHTSRFSFLATSPEELKFHGWRLLHRLCEKHDVGTLLQYLCPVLFKKVQAGRLVQLLNWVKDEHEKRSLAKKAMIRKIFDWVLTSYVSAEKAKHFLPTLFLMSREGQWKEAGELCADVIGVAKHHIVDDEQLKILRTIIAGRKFSPDRKTKSSSITISSKTMESALKLVHIRLKEFFEPFEGQIAQELICFFLNILGDNPGTRKLAENFRGSHSIEWYREQIPWKEILNQKERLYGYSLESAFAEHRFIVELVKGEKEIPAVSLIGNIVKVPIEKRYDALVVGHPFYFRKGKGDEWIETSINLTDCEDCKKLLENAIRTEEKNLRGKLVLHVKECKRCRNNSNAQRDIEKIVAWAKKGTESSRLLVVQIKMRLTDPDQTSPDQFSAALKKTTEYLLADVYRQTTPLGAIWDELDRSEQFDIRIAQQLVLNHIPFYLSQLGVHKHPRLLDLLNQWDEARCRREEHYDSPKKKAVYDAEEREVLGKIQDLLKNDEGVQAAVLQAVRTKMTDYQYSTSSIPFELFQNADDAVVELAMVKAYPKTPEEVDTGILPDHVKRFLVVDAEDSLQFVHWGRPINAVGSAGFPGREKGFHHDLEKMLILSSSDKSSDEKVTGKFGLGFKSVLLASDRPQLLSGRLALEIIAGLCPVPLKESSHLRHKLVESSPDCRWQGTLLNLPLTDEERKHILHPFADQSGLMTIFAKQIRRIDIDGEKHRAWEWKPEVIPLSCNACLELGELPMSDGHRQKGLALYFKLEGGGILFALGPDGFRPLPEDVPVIWVVAPTRESTGLGFAVNCMFDLDAGRSRLTGNSDGNYQRAGSLGRAMGLALQKLYDMTREGWDELRSRFRLEDDLSQYAFWATLWKVAGEGLQSRGSDEVGTLVAQLLCGDNGLGYLVSHEDAMPNGLWGDYQSLTRPEKIRIIIKGSLGNERIFRELVEWEFFRSFIGAPEAVTTYAVYTIARRVFLVLGQARNQWKLVQFADVLHNLAETEKKITPNTAGTLGGLLNHSALKHDDFEKERELIEKVLHSFSFKTQGGSFQSADEILALAKHTQANPDETKRASFAPEKYVLSKEYQDNGLDLFFACREKISIPVDTIAQWLLDAPTEQKKGHGLRYLLDGEHGEKVTAILRARGLGGTWLAELRPDSTCFVGWDNNDILEILFRKLPSIEDLQRLHAETDEDLDELPEEELRKHDPKEILQKIHSWWIDTKQEHLADYERRTYPEGVSLNLGEDDVGRIDRKSWLILFSLAHFHTMGRQRDVQHKGFIEECVQKGWWNIFADERPEEKSDKWMGVLEEYIDDQVALSKYELWMNRFPAIYKFSRWLEDYKEAFLSIERTQSLSGITGILKTRVNADFQGGGVSAPPIEKSLGIGACFALRELKRKKIINGSQSIPFCYVPVKRVRELCGIIGCGELMENGGIENSKVIHSFLCRNLGDTRADFSNCYDIPLQILAERTEILRMILN